MSSKLIADSGSTKCEWCYIHNNKKIKIKTDGINPYFTSAETIDQIISKKVFSKLQNEDVNEIHFYGAGMGNTANATLVKQILRTYFAKSLVKIYTDLEGSAVALCQQSKGVVAILGTGSNCGYYNGKKILKKQNSLGYILGDEGSGCDLGKRVLQHYLYQVFDAELMDKFEATYQLTPQQIIHHVYKEPYPNRFIASFAPFVIDNKKHYMMQNMIEDALTEFFYRHIFTYKESWTNKLHFSGSIAYALKDDIKTMCHLQQLELGNIIKMPMDGLIQFHS